MLVETGIVSRVDYSPISIWEEKMELIIWPLILGHREWKLFQGQNADLFNV